jgi:hypothetical protein
MSAATNKMATSPHKKGIGLGPESTGACQRISPKYVAQLMNNSAKIPQIHCLTLSPSNPALTTYTRNTSAESMVLFSLGGWGFSP